MGVIKNLLVVILLLSFNPLKAQQMDSLRQFKKRLLETVEVDLLMSYYEQEGTHAAVTGGLGNEYLTDYNPTIVVRIPLSEDEVLTADVGISAYTSASSSNGNPFNQTGASYGSNNDQPTAPPKGSPWITSSGASAKDVLTTLSFNYQKASDDRNQFWGLTLGGSTEYDYESFSFGGSFTKLWNDKNTELTLKTQLFFDRWKPIIPTELHEYETFQSTFLYNPDSYFYAVSIIDALGNSVASYEPTNFTSYLQTNRNSYAFSVGFSQILSPKLQGAVFMDFVLQEGLLSNPLQRVYFQDRSDYYIGNFNTLANYDSPENDDLFHLADDVERMPSQRIKTPIGMRLNYYFNEYMVFRSYFRHYNDDWGIRSNTLQLEFPVRFSLSWKIVPIYRYYNQTAADFFAPYNQNLSTDRNYTSDYDLSKFTANQWGVSFDYRSVLSTTSIAGFGLKSAQLRLQNYQRSDGLNAFIVSTAVQFVLDK